MDNSKLNDLLNCRCEEKYTIEPHGKGYAIYFGRCQHRHGENMATISECGRKDFIPFFEKALNQADKWTKAEIELAEIKGKQLSEWFEEKLNREY